MRALSPLYISLPEKCIRLWSRKEAHLGTKGPSEREQRMGDPPPSPRAPPERSPFSTQMKRGRENAYIGGTTRLVALGFLKIWIDLLHLGVIWWAYPIEVPCNLETRGSRAKEILSTSPDLGLSALCLIPFSENKDRVSQMWPECPASKTPGGAYSKR